MISSCLGTPKRFNSEWLEAPHRGSLELTSVKNKKIIQYHQPKTLTKLHRAWNMNELIECVPNSYLVLKAAYYLVLKENP